MNPYLIVAAGAGLALFAGSAVASINPDPESDDYSSELPLNYDENLNAYLAVLRAGESSDNYKALVGGGEFQSFADHPSVTEGFEGIVTSAGPSHAAGAYQFQPGTWKEAQAALGLPDFSPASQDQAAIFLIKRRGAYQAVRSGYLEVAQQLLRNEWASLADRGQSWVNTVYADNGGTFA